MGTKQDTIRFIGVDPFQFHFGLMGTVLLEYRPTPKVSFQFHFGLMGTPCNISIINTKHLFQFHFGLMGTHVSGGDNDG